MKRPWPKTLTGNVPTQNNERQWSPKARRKFRFRLAWWLFKAGFWVMPDPDVELRCELGATTVTSTLTRNLTAVE